MESLAEQAAAVPRQRVGALHRADEDGAVKHSVEVDWVLLGLLAVAFSVRVAAILVFPSIYHPDENFQAFEQAHRLAFGYGIVPWEFVAGIRSPVLPFIFAAIFRLSAPFVGGPQGYLIVARLLLAAASLVAVAAVYRMGRRTSPAHGLVGGLVAATWFEFVYFAGRPLTEAIATTVFLLALTLASVPEDKFTFRRLVAIGFTLGLCLMIRVHLAAGLFVIAVWVGRLSLRTRWWPMTLGAAIPLAVFGVADWIAWGGFFHSYVEAVRANLVQGRASHFGTEPSQWYAEQLYSQWKFALAPLAVFIFVRVRAAAMWILAALVIIAIHSAIPHKEYRFILPACACLVIVAAMGSADLLERAGRLVRPLVHRGLVFSAALLWVEISVALASAPQFEQKWFKARQYIMASFALTEKTDLCGLLFYDNFWFNTGGYAHLHRNVPFYSLREDETVKPEKSSSSFNAVVLTRSFVPDFVPRFHIQQCFSSPVSEDVCLLVRDGSCIYEKDMDVFLAPGTSLLGVDEPTGPTK